MLELNKSSRIKAAEWKQLNESSRMKAAEWKQLNESSRMNAAEWNHQNESSRMKAAEWKQLNESSRMEAADWKQLNESIRMKAVEWKQQKSQAGNWKALGFETKWKWQNYYETFAYCSSYCQRKIKKNAGIIKYFQISFRIPIFQGQVASVCNAKR